MIKVLIEIELKYPYKKSIITLVDFCSLWDCALLGGGTKRMKALISMPFVHFKKIFGENPRVGEYKIPQGTEYFTTLWKVKKVKT